MYNSGQACVTVEFPDRKMAFGSKYPTFAFSYQHGWKNIFGSDVDFEKWSFSVWNNMNFKLKGQLDYRFSIGGFFKCKICFHPGLSALQWQSINFCKPVYEQFSTGAVLCK